MSQPSYRPCRFQVGIQLQCVLLLSSCLSACDDPDQMRALLHRLLTRLGDTMLTGANEAKVAHSTYGRVWEADRVGYSVSGGWDCSWLDR